MKAKAPLKLYTLEQLTDKHIGKRGTAKREQYEAKLKLEVLGDMIRQVRHDRQLTQEELGKLIGVQKAQISRLENNATNVTIDTILRVFSALQAKITFQIELKNRKVRLV